MADGLDLDAIEATLARATPGPWRVESNGLWGGPNFYDEVMTPGRVDCSDYCYGGVSVVEISLEDQALIIAARNALPALVAAVRDRDEELDELREATFPKSWGGFRAFLDEVYPADVFPDDGRDLGPSFVVAARRLATVEAALASLRADWVVLYDVAFTPREFGDGVADDLERIAARGRDVTGGATVETASGAVGDGAGQPAEPTADAGLSQPPPVACEPVKTACEGFKWIGQSFAHCDGCGLPYWEHTHDQQLDRDKSPFDGNNPWVLVPITPEQAASCRARWAE